MEIDGEKDVPKLFFVNRNSGNQQIPTYCKEKNGLNFDGLLPAFILRFCVILLSKRKCVPIDGGKPAIPGRQKEPLGWKKHITILIMQRFVTQKKARLFLDNITVTGDYTLYLLWCKATAFKLLRLTKKPLKVRHPHFFLNSMGKM